MLLIGPLGDSLERRRVIVTMAALVSVALRGVALAPSLGWMVAASFAVGLTTVVPQLLVPFAARLARLPSAGESSAPS